MEVAPCRDAEISLVNFLDTFIYKRYFNRLCVKHVCHTMAYFFYFFVKMH